MAARNLIWQPEMPPPRLSGDATNQMLSKLLIASMLASASADCAGWCNSWTCGFNSCDTCEVCTKAAFEGGNCYSWCNPCKCRLNTKRPQSAATHGVTHVM